MSSLRDRFHDVDVIEPPDVLERALIREPAASLPPDREPRAGKLATIAVAAAIAVLAIALVMRAFPTGSGTSAPGATFSVPNDPCDLLTVAEIEQASGGHVTGTRQLTSSDYPLALDPGSRLPCQFGTDTRFGAILVSTDPNGTTAFDEVRDENPSNVPISSLGDEAFAGDKNSVWVRIGDSYFSVTADRRAHGQAVPMLISLARAAIQRGETTTPTISSVAPAGNGVIAFGCGSQICTATPDGSRITDLTEGDNKDLLAFSGTPVFSPDGSKIAFVGVDHQGSSSGGGANYDIYVMNAVGSDVANLTTSPEDVQSGDSQGSPTWSPDGSMIAYWNDSSDHAAQGVYVMNTDGSDQHKVSGGGESLSWSPDGSRIVFSLNDGLWTIHPDGTGLTQLTQSPSYDQSPTWSPDGSRIAFVRDGSVYVVKADGIGLRDVAGVKGLEAFQPQWSPDGTELAFEADDVSSDVYASDIYVVNADGTGLKAIAHDPDLDENWPVWSPDGTMIAYAITDNLTPLNDGTWDLYVMRPDGTDSQRLTTDAHLGAEFDISWQRAFG